MKNNPEGIPENNEHAEMQKKLRAAIMAAPIAKPPRKETSTAMMSSPFDDNQYQRRPSNWKIFSDADKTPPKQITWAIQHWLPEGVPSLIVGPPNTGKNTIANAFAAAFSWGASHSLWHGTAPNGYGVSIISSTEEDFQSKTLPKFIAAGGNTKLYKEFTGIPAFHPTIAFRTRRCNFSDADNAIWLAEAKKIVNLALLIFDPASQLIRGSASNSKDREGHEKMGEFAKELNCVALGIAHTPKATKGKDIYARIAGSGAVGQVARSIIMISKIKSGPTQDGATHVMVLAKAYGAPVNYGVTYRIVGCEITDEDGQVFETSKVVWLGLIPGTPEEILEWADGGCEMVVAGEIDPVAAAINLVKEALKNGPVHGKEVEKQAKAAGITTRDLVQAKKILGVKSDKLTGAGQSSRWYWRLPDSEPKKPGPTLTLVP